MLLAFADRWTVQFITAFTLVFNSATNIEGGSDEVPVAYCLWITTAYDFWKFAPRPFPKQFAIFAMMEFVSLHQSVAIDAFILNLGVVTAVPDGYVEWTVMNQFFHNGLTGSVARTCC